jgi:Zn-dependent metalloprotease
MAKLKGLTAKVEPHHRYKTPHQIYDIKTQGSSKSPRKIAEATLKKIAGDLKIKPDLSQLKFDKVRQTILGSHVLYQQYHLGKPISGAWIRVDVDKDGRVFNIHNDLVSEPAMVKTRKADAKRAATTETKQLSASEAKALAIAAAAPAKGDATRVVSSESCYYKYNGVPTLSWKVIVKTTPPRSGAKARRPAEWKDVYRRANGSDSGQIQPAQVHRWKRQSLRSQSGRDLE